MLEMEFIVKQGKHTFKTTFKELEHLLGKEAS
jgi:hypothetical protein